MIITSADFDQSTKSLRDSQLEAVAPAYPRGR
jgi:hypothetical protein